MAKPEAIKVKVYVTLKKSVLDPQGQAVCNTLGRMGFDEVQDVRIGKYVELDVQAATSAEAVARTEDMCRQLIANTVIEDFRVEAQ